MKKQGKQGKDYYKQIDTIIKRWEKTEYNPVSPEWVTERISWCWKFRHITEKQMIELCDRMIYLYENKVFV